MNELINNETLENVTEAVAESTIKSGNKLAKAGIIGGALALAAGATYGAIRLGKKVVGKIKAKKAKTAEALPEGAEIADVDLAEVETIKD